MVGKSGGTSHQVGNDPFGEGGFVDTGHVGDGENVATAAESGGEIGGFGLSAGEGGGVVGGEGNGKLRVEGRGLGGTGRVRGLPRLLFLRVTVGEVLFNFGELIF